MNEFEKYDVLERNISVKIIADSISQETLERVTTALWHVPRFLLPQLNTHRAFSRNVSSSRAKKLSKTLLEVRQNPYVPYIWQAKHKGMQGSKLLSPFRSQLASIVWKASANSQLMFAWLLDKIGVSNQYANRIIEPYMYVDYLVTSTDWNNFFYQRDDWHAQLEIQIVARRMKQALKLSIPDTLHSNDWHLPFVTEDMLNNFTLQECIKISVARCARTSYKTGALFDYQTDLDLFNTLIGSPPHFSPFEHQVVANGNNGGNLDGVTQLRKIIENQLMSEKEFTHEYFDMIIDEFYT